MQIVVQTSQCAITMETIQIPQVALNCFVVQKMVILESENGKFIN